MDWQRARHLVRREIGRITSGWTTPAKRPLCLSVLPDPLKTAAFQRWYNPAPERWQYLFGAAPLRYAPGVAMELLPPDVIHSSIALAGFASRR
jgi:hypothetical protein